MGLMILTSKQSTTNLIVKHIEHQKLHRNGALQAQAFVITLIDGEKYCFVYCRSTPNNADVKPMRILSSDCCLIIGDFNLSHRNLEDIAKIEKLCGSKKISALNEITRSRSNN